MILTGKKVLELFKKNNQEEFRVEKVIKEKGDEYMLNIKDTMVRLIAGQIKNIYYR